MTKIDGLKVGIAAAIAFGCLSIPQSLGQNARQAANVGSSVRVSSPPSVVGGAGVAASAAIESSIDPVALEIYEHAVRELHQGHAAAAEKDARHAFEVDKRFPDAAALAATAALEQQQYDRARQEATEAVQLNSADEKAWVILATAQNYLGHASDAIDALRHVGAEHQGTWQVAYQWARAEAGLQNLKECLEWTNRAALSAPPAFGPLHLLRASVLLTMGENARAADELEIYLRLPSVNASQREQLTQELHRIRQLPQKEAGSSQASGN